MSADITEFKVSLEIPKGADEDDVVEYITDALESHAGAYHPSNPFFDADLLLTVEELYVKS